MKSEDVKERIETKLNAECYVTEFSGSNDHYSVIVISPKFKLKTTLQKHRMVMELFADEIESGEVHALTIKNFTPSEWKEYKNDANRKHK